MKRRIIIKRFFIFLLVVSWMFTGWPGMIHIFAPYEIKEVYADTQTYTAGQSGTFNTPAGAVNLVIELWGGGGGGGAGPGNTTNAGGGGGGGGAYVIKTIASPASSYTYSVGTAGSGGAIGSPGSSGGSTTFGGSTYIAAGGGGGGVGPLGAGGTAGTGTGGDTNRSGGTGATAISAQSGGGGGGAGTNNPGGNGGTPNVYSEGTGGSELGGNGGVGCNVGSNCTGGNAATTGVYGGGGGGGMRNAAGGNGAGGYIRLTWDYATTTLATGTDPASATVAPGTSITEAGAFTFQTNTGSDSVTQLVVSLAGSGTPYEGLAQAEIRGTSCSGTLYYSAITSFSGNSLTFSGGTSISVTTSQAEYKVCLTPRTHANMPVPNGAEYLLSPYVTSFTSTNTQSGSDSNANTLTIDNLSPNGATSTSGSAGDQKVTLNWTTSSSSDFDTTNGSVILRWASGSAGSEVPAEGNSSYTAGDTITTATVACVISSSASTSLSKIDGLGGDTGCTTTALTNGQQYTYTVFQRDTRGNYDTGTSIGTFTPTAASASFTQNDFRFYEDEATVTLTNLWGSVITGDNQDIPIVPSANNPPGPGENIRLQINITVGTTDLSATTQAFKLQFKQGTDQDCSTGSWTDIGAKGATDTAWRLFDNTSLGDTETEVNQISTSDVAGGYSELVTSATNPNAVSVGQDMEWDWPIESYLGQVADATTYSFRMVESDGTVLSYSPAGDCPTVETEPGMTNFLRHGNVFVDEVEKGFFWVD